MKSVLSKENVSKTDIFWNHILHESLKKDCIKSGTVTAYSSISMSLIFNLTRVCKNKKKFINKLKGFTKFFKGWDYGHA